MKFYFGDKVMVCRGISFPGHEKKEHYSQRVHPSTHTEGNIGGCKFLKYLIGVHYYTISNHEINHIKINNNGFMYCFKSINTVHVSFIY